MLFLLTLLALTVAQFLPGLVIVKLLDIAIPNPIKQRDHGLHTVGHFVKMKLQGYKW